MTTMQATQTQVQARPQADRFLRRVVQLDAVIFFITGLCFVLATEPAATLFGMSTAVVLALGIGALLYDIFRLGWTFTQPTLGPRFAWLTIGVNVLFAAGLAIVLATGIGDLTRAGWWLFAAVIDLGIVFAALQYWGLHRMR